MLRSCSVETIWGMCHIPFSREDALQSPGAIPATPSQCPGAASESSPRRRLLAVCARGPWCTCGEHTGAGGAIEMRRAGCGGRRRRVASEPATAAADDASPQLCRLQPVMDHASQNRRLTCVNFGELGDPHAHRCLGDVSMV